MYGYRSTDFLALPDDLAAFAWSAPMRELAARIGVSDVGLKKILTASGIVTPPQGYWNRVHAGRKVPDRPRAGPRQPGETGRIRLDERFRGHVADTAPMPEEGPFVSANVPEDLGELRELERGKIGRVAAPRDLSRPHAGLAQLLRKEEARREKAEASRWHWDEPHFGGALGQRQLRLASGLFTALAGRGHAGEAWEDQEELRLTCTIGDTTLRLGFAIVGKHRTQLIGGRQRPARDLPAKTPLRLALGWKLRSNVQAAWQDDDSRPLESRLADIAADLIVAGEAAFRQSLVEAREHAEEMRAWEDQRRRERIERLNQERLQRLETSGALLRQAEELRALVERVGTAVAGGSLAVSAGELAAWRAWALARADAIDPVCSGQVLEHIRETEDGQAGPGEFEPDLRVRR